MVGGVIIASTIAKRSGQNPGDYEDMALYAILFAVLGARLYFVLFNWDYYSEDLTRILNIREGGLGIYGGIIAAIITVYILTRRKKLDFGLVADTAAPALIFGQCLGRWGNFFNREAFGGYTDNLLAMQLPVSAVRRNEITAELWEHAVEIEGITYIQVHPTFLYESLWNFALMIGLLIYWKHRKFNGEVFLLYLLIYGFGRFWIESLRTDQLILPILEVPVSMVVAALMMVGSATWIVLGRKKSRMAEEK
jgi:phosphatidylglycerol:prolipoprotein diacylglycerol transferase